MEKCEKKLQTNLFLRHFIPKRLTFCKKKKFKRTSFFPNDLFEKEFIF